MNNQREINFLGKTVMAENVEPQDRFDVVSSYDGIIQIMRRNEYHRYSRDTLETTNDSKNPDMKKINIEDHRLDILEELEQYYKSKLNEFVEVGKGFWKPTEDTIAEHKIRLKLMGNSDYYNYLLIDDRGVTLDERTSRRRLENIVRVLEDHVSRLNKTYEKLKLKIETCKDIDVLMRIGVGINPDGEPKKPEGPPSKTTLR